MGGRVTPGSHVAVLGSFDSSGGTSEKTTGIILHKALVTNVQVDENSSKPDDPDVAPTAKVFVTLAGTADQVTSVTFAAEHGTVWLAAEPSDLYACHLTPPGIDLLADTFLPAVDGLVSQTAGYRAWRERGGDG